jgi:hypothetical protein
MLPHMMVRVCLVAAVVFGAARIHAGAEPPAGTWDPAAAARYLDARMDAWWTQAKTLRTGDGETKCVSCHTAVPYALVRPKLRAALGEAAPTAHETRMLDHVRRRVASTAADQPYYDHTEAKKVESRGVEAVLNALILTHLAAPGAAGADAHIQKAMSRLWETQRADGAWDWLDFGLEPYETPDAMFYGATAAAIAAGSPAGKRASTDATAGAGIERLRKYLRVNLASQRSFNRAWALLAAAHLDGVLTDAGRNEIVTELESKQRADGGWSLADLGPWRWQRSTAPFAPPGKVDDAVLAASDGYATGLVVYAMRQSGLAADGVAIRRGQEWLRAHQLPARGEDAAWAPWRSHSLNFDREHGGSKGEPWRRMFMSDLATAFAALALM